MATLPPDKADELRHDILALSEEIQRGISPKRVVAANTTWERWSKFCHEHGWDPGLSDFSDPVPTILLFGKRWREGRLAPGSNPTRARTAEDAMRQVGQAFSMVGALDPRLNAYGKMDYRITRVVRFWKNEDGPSRRKRPVPKVVIIELTRHAQATRTQQQLAVSDLVWIGFYWMLRPSEYVYTTRHKTPFVLHDVILKCGEHEYRGDTIPLDRLSAVTSAGFEFETQKNGISGDIVLHGTTTDAVGNPKAALVRRVRHLRLHSAAASTPIFLFYDERRRARKITDRVLTDQLRVTAQSLGLDVRPQ